MPTASRTFRVFVSSTFSDLKAERNALQERVFPDLRRFCAAQGWQFQAVDLRWGVSEEAGLDQRTMRICLKEIERCRRVSPRPNFLVLLGDRYGWRPLPEEIPFFEFEKTRRRVGASDPAMLDLLEWRENQPEDRKGWYRRDDNALVRRPGSELWEPGMFVLRPREERFKDFAVWETEVGRPLGEALERAAAGMNLPEEARIKYGASATEQEIHHGALWIPDAREHVLAFCRTLLGEDGQPLGQACALGRRAASGPDDPLRQFLDLDHQGRLEREAYNRQQALKERLSRHVGDRNTTHYQVPWREGKADEEYLARLCADVRAGLERIIRAQMEQFEDLTPEEIERQQHENFAQERTRIFVGREEPLRRIAGYLDQPSPGKPLAVLGVSGSGKSALMARAVDEARRAHPNSHILVRYIGATPPSSDVRSLLEGLCRELGECYGLDNADLPGEYEKLIGVLRERLAAATERTPLIVFLDALDQLGDSHNAHALAWLPFELPENVRMVVSAIAPDETAGEELEEAAGKERKEGVGEGPEESAGEGPAETAREKREEAPNGKRDESAGEELEESAGKGPAEVARGKREETAKGKPDESAGRCGKVFIERLPIGNRVEVTPLSQGEAAEALEALLAREEPSLTSGCGNTRRLLTGRQRDAVMAGFRACPLPLYLRIAAEQTRLWASWHPAPQLPGTVEGLLIALFQRLSDPREHGPLLVDRALSYLRCARHGLSEDELLEILPRDEEYWNDFLKHAKHDLPDLPRPTTDRSDSADDPDQSSIRNPQSAIRNRVLPAVVWLRLYHDLEHYLTHRAADGASLLNFFHRQLPDGVDAAFLTDSETRRACHERLAKYFADQPLYLEPAAGASPDTETAPAAAESANLRKLAELPWQLLQAEEWHWLAEILGYPTFFSTAWVIDRFDIQTTWAALEARGNTSASDTYLLTISEPQVLRAIGWAVACLLESLGHWDRTISLYQQSADYYKSQENTTALCQCLVHQASLRFRQGDLNTAYQLILEIVDLMQATLEQGQEVDNLTVGAPSVEKTNAAAAPWGSRSAGDILEYALRIMGWIRRDQGDWASATAITRMRMEVASEHGDESDLRDAERDHMLLLSHQKRNRGEAVSLLGILEERYHAAGEKEHLATCFANHAMLLLDAGDLAEAEALCLKAERLFRELGNKSALQKVLGSQGDILTQKGDLAGALALYEKRAAMCQELHFRRDLALSWSDQADIFAAQGEKRRAMELYTRAAEVLSETGCSNHLIYCLIGRARALRNLGDRSAAFQELEKVKAIARSVGDTRGLAAIFAFQAGWALAENESDLAVTLYDESARLYKETGNPVNQLKVLGLQAELLFKLGRRQACLSVYQEEERICRELEDSQGLARAVGSQALMLSYMEGRQKDALPKALEAQRLARQAGLVTLQEAMGAIIKRFNPFGLAKPEN